MKKRLKTHRQNDIVNEVQLFAPVTFLIPNYVNWQHLTQLRLNYKTKN